MGKNKTLRTTIYLSDLILNFIESISNNGFVEGKDNDGAHLPRFAQDMVEVAISPIK